MASVPAIASGLRQPLTRPTSGFAPTNFWERRLSAAEVLWMTFVLVQVLDGVFSYIGVSLHGPAIEGNPLVAWYLGAFGPAMGFTMAKLFAISCGAILYLTKHHHWVALLTLFYIVFAVGPWTHVLVGTS
jgi:hypothetical protein